MLGSGMSLTTEGDIVEVCVVLGTTNNKQITFFNITVR